MLTPAFLHTAMDHSTSPALGEHVRVTIMEDSGALSRAVACRIAERITEKARTGEESMHVNGICALYPRVSSCKAGSCEP